MARRMRSFSASTSIGVRAGLDGDPSSPGDVRRRDVVGEGLALEVVPAAGLAAGLGRDERLLDGLDDLLERHPRR